MSHGAPVALQLPGGESFGIALDPEVPHQVRRPRWQGAGQRRGGGAGFEELFKGMGREAPSAFSGLPAGVIDGDLLQPGSLEVRGKGRRRGPLPLSGGLSLPLLMPTQVARPVEMAQAPQQPVEEALVPPMAARVLGLAALVVVLGLLDVRLFFLLLCAGVCVEKMTKR
nr:hypothetical protein [uncultured Roseateles sp.]